MAEIRLLLAEDHDVVRTGLRAFIDKQPGLKVVAEAATGLQAVERAADLVPDIVLMDITMPDLDGLEATRRIKQQLPNIHVLALTVHDDKQYFMAMLAAGASGYLTKQAAADELVAAIRSVSQGHVYLQPALARWLLEDYQRLAATTSTQPKAPDGEQQDARGLGVLSPRERQVLELIAQGRSNVEIGQQLGLSHKTIGRHRERIMGRLKLHSRTELVKFAIRHHLITID
jgi:DNA-binding NarL/FixJ family response regulator